MSGSTASHPPKAANRGRNRWGVRPARSSSGPALRPTRLRARLRRSRVEHRPTAARRLAGRRLYRRRAGRRGARTIRRQELLLDTGKSRAGPKWSTSSGAGALKLWTVSSSAIPMPNPSGGPCTCSTLSRSSPSTSPASPKGPRPSLHRSRAKRDELPLFIGLPRVFKSRNLMFRLLCRVSSTHL
jgi:hypothetical protein